MADQDPPVEKVATLQTQQQYSQANLDELLKNIPGYSAETPDQEIVDSLRNLAEFICYSEQYKLTYFDSLMQSNVLLIDMPRLLALDSYKVNQQLI